MMIAIAAQKCCQRQPLTIDVYCSENIVIKQVAFMTFLLFSGRGRVSVEGNPYPQQSGAKCELRPSTGTFARRFPMAGAARGREEGKCGKYPPCSDAASRLPCSCARVRGNCATRVRSTHFNGVSEHGDDPRAGQAPGSVGARL